MDKVNELLSSVPHGVLLVLSGFGALFLLNKTLGYLQFVLNVFILSGTNVSRRISLPFLMY